MTVKESKPQMILGALLNGSTRLQLTRIHHAGPTILIEMRIRKLTLHSRWLNECLQRSVRVDNVIHNSFANLLSGRSNVVKRGANQSLHSSTLFRQLPPEDPRLSLGRRRSYRKSMHYLCLVRKCLMKD